MAGRLLSIIGYSIALTSLLMSLAVFLSIYFGYVPYFIEPNKIIVSLEIALIALGLFWMLDEIKSAITQESYDLLSSQAWQNTERKIQKKGAYHIGFKAA